MNFKNIVLIVYSSFYFLLSILLECYLYQITKKDDSMDWLFYSIVIFRILDKYNISFLNVFPFFTLGPEALFVIHLDELESALKKLEKNNRNKLIASIKRRLNNLLDI